MRKALAAMLLLAGCTAADGVTAPECDSSWRDVESLIVTDAGDSERPVALDCIRQIDDRRIRIGFHLPPGPDCWVLSDYRLVESADAVSVSLLVARLDDPTAGACPPDERRVTTEIDLQAPVDDRELRDGGTVLERASPDD